jgi:uncharacterized MAPEG superfamily protein
MDRLLRVSSPTQGKPPVSYPRPKAGIALASAPGFATLRAMTTELSVLAWGCVLAILHIFIAVRFKTRQYGTAWNMGARDEDLPPAQPIVGRLARAQANFFETFPVMAAAILIVSVAKLESQMTALGALLWLGARLVYLPLYAFGVPKVRTAVFIVSIAGIALVLRPALVASFA